MDAMALLELPRGCDYWNDERMKCMINGTDSYIHDFDGCMYGLTTQFGDQRIPIKKPWRIVSNLVYTRSVIGSMIMENVKVEKQELHRPTPTRLSTSFSNQYVDTCLFGSRSRCRRRTIHAAVAGMIDVQQRRQRFLLPMTLMR